MLFVSVCWRTQPFSQVCDKIRAVVPAPPLQLSPSPSPPPSAPTAKQARSSRVYEIIIESDDEDFIPRVATFTEWKTKPEILEHRTRGGKRCR
jgi:hypothetical protein